MHKKSIIIKFGGSVLTDKSKAENVLDNKVQSLIQITSKLVKKSVFEEVVLVHGAGSFGHPTARKFNLDGNFRANTSEGIVKTLFGVRKLNQHLLEMCLQQELLAVSVFLSNAGLGKINKLNFQKVVKELLAFGMIPLIGGDILFLKNKKYRIISGDEIVRILVEIMVLPTVIMVSDTKGVYDQDGNTIQILTEEMFENLGQTITGAVGFDMTGGMRQKILELLQIKAKAQKIVICSWENFEKVIDGDYTHSTQII
jgi:isopentenyl phosphate kinase